MTHKTVITDNYILITSDEEIKIGDYRTNIQRGYVKLVDKVDDVDYFNKRNDVFKKVIAHLPLGIIPIKGVPLLPPLPSGEDDVEKLADDYVSDVYVMAQIYAIKSGSKNIEARRKGFVDGYLEAKENTYTEEQVREAIDMSRKGTITENYGDLEIEYLFDKEQIIQSLKQPK